ncbi:MAG TPA: Glu/Leu/Phe/Val dehydrogenase dimerization domain-containing protein [Gaiellaceae bacterium]|nr:Glu/Leu/Phe/Val dehydrogenase dimerization domain-containing protein [Gaiellaceae bacterium]
MYRKTGKILGMFEELIRAWDGEQVVIRYDEPSGAWIFVCIHSTALGPAGGGTRMRVYDSPADGLADAMRLSQAMTLKLAVANAGRGGGKAVLAVPELPTGERRRELLLAYGRLVASLGGTYRTAGDMNVSPADLDVVKEVCPWVYGTTTGGGNSGVGTARAVFHGIRASVAHLFGDDDLRGRRVLVQGAGAVGADLVRFLRDAGADVLVADVDEARARATGAELVPAADAVTTECDVYAPCAVGGTLNADTIPRLRCRIVAGSANNQLATPEDAARLRDAGILYAPDFVINAGGVIQLVGLEDRGLGDAELEAEYAGVGETLRRIFADADALGITTAEAAERLAAERVSQKREEPVA